MGGGVFTGNLGNDNIVLAILNGKGAS